MAAQSSGRYIELDSLRGLAAMTVVFHHFILVLPGAWEPHTWVLLKYTPLHVFWQGYSAVMFFFVLSGFVLSLPFHSRHVRYAPFVLRRVFRIYPPYLVAVGLALLAYSLLSRNGIPTLSPWFNQVWTVRPTPRLILDHVLLLPSFPNSIYDPVLWSLVQEMRVSLVFPLLMILVARRRPGPLILLGVLLSAMAPFINPLVAADYGTAIGSLLMFVVGALLAKHRAWIVSRLETWPLRYKIMLLLTGLVAYTFPAWFLPVSLWPGIALVHVLDGPVITAGVAAIICLGISWNGFRRLLHRTPVVILGKMSYSIYLLHAILLLSAVYLLYGRIPLPAIWLIALVVLLPAAWLSYVFIELPAIRMGRRLEQLWWPKTNPLPLVQEVAEVP